MSTNRRESLRSAWNELSKHTARQRQFLTKRLSTSHALDLYAGLRAADDAPCIIVRGTLSPHSEFVAGGIRLTAYDSDNEQLLVLSLEDSARADLFSTVSEDVIAASDNVPKGQSLQCFLTRLDAWRKFLRDRRSGLARNEIVGLIGELLILAECLQHNAEAYLYWAAPENGKHDFIFRGRALEVKTTLGSAAKLRISSLEQLDTAGLQCLTLIHVPLVEAQEGKNLSAIIDGIVSKLPDEDARREFSNALLRRGLMPDDKNARAEPLVSLQSILGYAVSASFPQLTPRNISSAICDVEYSLQMVHIEEHLVDANLEIAKFVKGTHDNG